MLHRVYMLVALNENSFAHHLKNYWWYCFMSSYTLFVHVITAGRKHQNYEHEKCWFLVRDACRLLCLLQILCMVNWKVERGGEAVLAYFKVLCLSL
jgi:hypothetical protein